MNKVMILGSVEDRGKVELREYSYDIIRITLACLVVLGHSHYYQISTAFGGIYLTDEMTLHGISDTLLHRYICALVAIIYSFHMPAFMVLSGALYRRNYRRYNTFKDLLKNKLRNLLFPYLIVWVCWNIPIKCLTGYYKDIPVWKWLVQIVIPYNVYLWFLLSLFIVFVLTYVLGRLKIVAFSLYAIIVLVSFVISLVCQRLIGMYMPLGNPLKYLLWFEIGGLLEEEKNRHSGIENSSYQKIVMLGSALIFVIAYHISQNVSHFGWVIRDTVCPMMGILFLWVIANYIAMGLKEKSKRKLLTISSYSMGLFLYAEPINYVVLYFVRKTCGIEYFGTNMGTVTIFITRIILSVLVSILIIKVLRKSKLRIRIY